MARIEATRLGLDIRFVVTDTECGSAEWIYKIRSAEQIKILISLAPDHIALPLTLALYTGQRQGDLLRLQWRQYGERIMLRQGQTGRHVSVKLAAPVKAMLERTRAALPALHWDDHHILLTARGGDAWTDCGFRNSWAKVKREEAKIVGRTFHDLRGTAATMLAMAGCGEAEIATIKGHSLNDVPSILDRHYIHRDVRLGDSGTDKLDAMIAAMASAANDSTIGAAREPRQPNGAMGAKRAAQRKDDEAA